MRSGRVLRFDAAKGYGFIAGDSDDEHIFFHVHDAVIEESEIRPGLRVVFDVRSGERGKYAVDVDGTDREAESPEGGQAAAELRTDRDELLGELTELLIRTLPSIAGREIVRFRREFVALAAQRGWLYATGAEPPIGGEQQC
ncbi:cold-shock protein [Nocardia sp. NPDC057353]|uniref:cold-shock protein n=1 Tax=Nocardia sp. NPDC057353 TaxID=3346104 RepID=UPI00362C6676